MEELAKHGITLPPNMQGLTEEQISELNLHDEWEDECIPQGGITENKDPLGKRNGKGYMQFKSTVYSRTPADKHGDINLSSCWDCKSDANDCCKRHFEGVRRFCRPKCLSIDNLVHPKALLK